MKAVFWGVRGSLPSRSEKYGGQTSCVEIQVDPSRSLFLDAGSGLRNATAGRTFEEVGVFLSHFHWDHIQGLPYAYFWENPQTKIQILSPFSDVRERLKTLFDTRFHPVDLLSKAESRVAYRIVPENSQWEFQALRCQAGEIHHPGKSYCLRVESDRGSFLYATDSDYREVKPSVAKLFEKVDFAVLDSQYFVGDELAKSDYGHASFKTALDCAAEYSIKTAVLFHFDPSYSDDDLDRMEEQARAYLRTKMEFFDLKLMMAKEGLELDF